MTADTMQLPRKALALLLAGQPLPSYVDPLELDADELLAWVRHEGVVAMVDLRLREGLADVPDPVRKAFGEAARGEAARLMAREAEARRVLGRLAMAGLPALLLKGSALAYWAWPAPYLRDCIDVDLLFADQSSALAAAALLASDGYVRRQHFGDAVTREFLCLRQMPNGGRLEMDMHWDLTGTPLFRGLFSFEELQAASMPLPALAPGARGLGKAHAMLHACMHRASGLSSGEGDNLKWLFDLHLVAQAFDPHAWQQLEDMAVGRGLAGITIRGLEATAALFSTSLPASTVAALKQAAADEPLDASRLGDWKYVQRANLRALPNWFERLRWLWQRLRPTAHYREDVGVAGSGLLRDRVQRALRQLRRR